MKREPVVVALCGVVLAVSGFVLSTAGSPRVRPLRSAAQVPVELADGRERAADHVASPSSASASPRLETSMEQALDAYYETGDFPDDFQSEFSRWCAAMRDVDATARDDAVRSICDLLEASRRLEEEPAGSGRNDMGERVRRSRHSVRWNLLWHANMTEPVEATTPVLEWYFWHDGDRRHQEEAAQRLARCKGPLSAAAWRRCVERPHPHSAVLATALKEVASRGVEVEARALRDLCGSHRRVIREAARALAAQRGLPDPAPYDPSEAIRRDALRPALEAVDALFCEPIPRDAPFVRYFRMDLDGDNVLGWESVHGWLKSETAESITIIPVLGSQPETRQRVKPPPPGQPAAVELEIIERSPYTLVAELDADQSESGNKWMAAIQSTSAGLDYDARNADAWRILIGRWLHRTGQHDLAARALIPALESLPRDGDLEEAARMHLGVIHGHDLLYAFAGKRDYDKALRLARLIRERLPGSMFHREAVLLERQLPHRKQDFRELSLPTKEAWAALRQVQDRAQQIRYLCLRLRLLRCYQDSQPGGVSYYDPQSANPSRLSALVAWGNPDTESPVINPLVELVGNAKAFLFRTDPPSKGLDLMPADVRHIAPFLKVDWAMPTISFWRDFHPSRTLHTTRPVVCDLINHAAGKKLCDGKETERWSEKQIEAEIARLIAWSVGAK